MTKLDFLFALQSRLEGLPKDEVRERIGFYAEMIEDRMEEGMPEEAAVAAVGSVEETLRKSPRSWAVFRQKSPGRL